jgi:hypothetical protein
LWRRVLTSSVLLAGCGRSDGPIVVWWTLETLGATAADETAVCAAITEVAAERGLTARCVPGAVAPSTWTLESHVRTLFPEHMAGPLRVNQRPDEGDRSVLARVADHHGGRYGFGSDNPVFDLWGERASGNGVVWTQGAEEVAISGDVRSSVGGDPLARASGVVIEAAGPWIRGGDPVALYLNAFDAGGHVPRCTEGIADPRCAYAWELALAYGLVDTNDAPTEAFASSALWVELLRVFAADKAAADPIGVRRATFDTTLASIDGGGLDNLRTSLDALLRDVEKAHREEDVVIVLAGDHGDAPCVMHPLIDGQYICEHDQAPTEWHAAVPVYVIENGGAVDRWRDNGWLAEDGRPWSLVNLAYGLLEATGQPIPELWPEPLPAGRAESWSCEPEGPGGVIIEGDTAEWCDHNTCVAGPWRMPELSGMTSGVDDAREAGPIAWTRWFDTWCLPGGPL